MESIEENDLLQFWGRHYETCRKYSDRGLPLIMWILLANFGDSNERKRLANEFVLGGTIDFAMKIIGMGDHQKIYDYLMEWSWDVDATTVENIIDKTLSNDVSVKDLAKRIYNFYYFTGNTPGVGILTREWADKKAHEYLTRQYEIMRAVEKKYNCPLLGVKWEKFHRTDSLSKAIKRGDFDAMRVMALRATDEEIKSAYQTMTDKEMLRGLRWIRFMRPTLSI